MVDHDESGKASLTYEETPLIDPSSGETIPVPQEEETPEDVIPEAARVFQPSHEEAHEAMPVHTAPSGIPTTPPSHHVQRKKSVHFGTVLFIGLLFGLGIWLSSQLRSFFAPVSTDEVSVPTGAPLANPTSILTTPAPSATSSASQWTTYQPMNGVTRQPVSGVSFQLPGNVKAPVCDGSNCSSQGTDLPGGTRLTVAPRGKGQMLPDFRGAILTDTSGHEFTMKQSVVGNIYVYEYIGNFTGRTGGGYTFTKMRGVLVPVSDTLAIDFNHFSPVGSVSDFAADDLLFEKIIQSFKSAGGTPSLRPSITTPTPVTPSGNNP